MDSREKLQGDAGEQAVNTLAFDTYLKYWCYPGPKDESNFDKEICDLLILFQDNLILISVKNYAFKGNYSRYFRSTLDKATAQLAGAERRLQDNSRPLVFRHADLGEIGFDPADYPNIHRIIVNHDIAPMFYPASRLTSAGNFVHIFNWDAFLGVVRELDTIPDFIQYLRERELIFGGKQVTIMQGDEADWEIEVHRSFMEYNTEFVAPDSHFLLISGRELDLMADYLWNNRKFNSNLYNPVYQGASFEFDGKYKRYLDQKEVQAKKQADRLSYFVDEFVKREVMYRNETTNLELAVELLSLSRFERRIVGSEFFAMLRQYRDAGPDLLVRRYGKTKDMVIAFVLYGSGMPHDMVLHLSQLAAEGYAWWNKYKEKKIVIISFSKEGSGFKFGLLNVQPFTAQHETELVHDLQLLKWFTDFQVFEVNHKEYPG
ncbi:hypothetical protein [Pedobacter sp. D749]|uniref:hypothetical protein n=1 Tax=Pedobacter sp. D749 TaxID=2856523 RepID=UPI001C56006C|nr:hypothetical protein [Pedobacter sp. D749]QXU43471.1 hypothetical protein KYH19_07775 [Pedobacter sp. D749]